MAQPFVLLPSNGSDPADEWVRLGVQAHTEGKFDQAEHNYRHALRLDPGSVVAAQNLAVAMASRGNLNEALLAAERAALMDGETALVHANRALVCLEADRVDEALEAAERAVRIAETQSGIVFPDPMVQSLFAKALICSTAGRPEESLKAYEEILAREPLHPAAGPNSCFVQSLVDSTPEELLFNRRRYAAAHRPPSGPQRHHPNDRNPDRVLRVGYVGGDFKTHSAAMIFGSVVLNHDPKRVEHTIYSSLPVNAEQDEMTRRFYRSVTFPGGYNTVTGSFPAVSRWRDIVPLSDDQAADLIRQDRIDVLVDLAAHTNGGRLGIFFRKPAPVQVTAWGFAHGSGLDEMDYFLADPVAVPDGERTHYSERIVDLPCIVGYLPPNYNVRGTSAAPSASREHFTFGSYARYEKLSDECLTCFAEILRRVPESKLQFKDHAFRRPYSIKRVLTQMNLCPKCVPTGTALSDCPLCQGSASVKPGRPEYIDPKRLLFSISTSHQDHMLAYQQCDLCLDPWPHGGGVVFLEQMWMGVPCLTLRGKQPSGRTGASVLTALGRSEWIAETKEEYIEKAVTLATDEEQRRNLASARKTLRGEFMLSPVVMNYAQAVEAKYREVWRKWCLG